MYPCASTLAPSRGVSGTCAALLAKSAHASWPTGSRSVKYTCPAGDTRACTTSPSTQRSLNSSPDWICAARRVTTCPTRSTRPGNRGSSEGGGAPFASRTLEILAGPRIDPDLVATLDEQRHAHAQSSLQSRRLRRAGCRVALETKVSLGDRENHRGRQLHADRIALVLTEQGGHPVGEVAHRVAELSLVERDLVVRRGVHEVVVRAVLVEVLHVAVVEPRPLEAVAGLKGLLNQVAPANVAQLHAHLGTAAPELDVLEFDHLVEIAVELDRHAALDLAGRDHVSLRGPRPGAPSRIGGRGSEPPGLAISQRRATSYPATPLPMT